MANMRNGNWWKVACFVAVIFIVRPFLVSATMQVPDFNVVPHCGMSDQASTTSGASSCLSHCVSSLVDFPAVLTYNILMVFAILIAYAFSLPSLFERLVPNLAPYVRQRDPCMILKTIKRE